MTKEIEVFMPGRLCILGEHSDWAASYRKINPNIEKGYALIAGLNLGIYIKCKISNRYKYSFLDNTIDLSYKEVISTNNTDFFSYVVSSMKQILLNYNVGGIDIVCEKMTLPMKKGLASSAAICMSIIRAYNLLYELGLSIREEMDLAYIAERSIGSKCGKLDQLCAFGKGVRLACIDGDEVTVTTLIPAKTLKMLLVDLHGSKNTKKILDDLNAQYPYSNSEKTDRLYEFLGVKNKETIFAAIEYIENGDANSLGKVMNNYQKQFDKCVAPYSDELKAPLLHRFIGASEKIDSIIACKGVGSQGDGTVQLLLSDKMDEEKYKSLVNMIIRNYG